MQASFAFPYHCRCFTGHINDSTHLQSACPSIQHQFHLTFQTIANFQRIVKREFLPGIIKVELNKGSFSSASKA